MYRTLSSVGKAWSSSPSSRRLLPISATVGGQTTLADIITVRKTTSSTPDGFSSVAFHQSYDYTLPKALSTVENRGCTRKKHNKSLQRLCNIGTDSSLTSIPYRSKLPQAVRASSSRFTMIPPIPPKRTRTRTRSCSETK